MPWEWNNDYDDLEQVAEWLPEFSAVREEIVSSGRYTYNDLFKGRIPDIAGPREDTAIYLLQGLYRQREMDARIAQWIAEGYEPISAVNGVEKFAAVILYRADRGGEFHRYESARLVPEIKPRQAEVTGNIRALLPKGKRTNGVYVGMSSYAVLVKR